MEWRKIDKTEPYRTLEVVSFQKIKDFWLIDAIMFYGPGWRTKIDFKKVDAGLVKNGTPKNLFKNIK